MYRVFNMGIGFVVVIRPRDAHSILQHFKRHKVPAFQIGRVGAGTKTSVMWK